MKLPFSVPKDFRDLTDEQWHVWVRCLAKSFDLKELRRYQGVVQSQMKTLEPIDKNLIAAGNLSIHNDILAAAVALQHGDPFFGFKSGFDRLRRWS